MKRMWSRNELKKNTQEYLANTDVKVKTIEQSEANWTLPITSFGTFAGLTANVIFGRVQKLNQELEIVILVSYTNETESNVTAYGTSFLPIELPEAIASKIYDCDGKNATENGGSKYIASVSGWGSRDKETDMSRATGTPRLFLINSPQANKIEIKFGSSSAIIVEPAGTTILEARIQLALI